MSYLSILKGNVSLISIESNTFTDYEGILQKELIFSLRNEVSVPERISYHLDSFYLICNHTSTKLSVRLYEGELKYFFQNYKDYYYLPKEDIAIHKDIASSVDKTHRKKATASTCYIKKHSIFLPQYELLIEPAFFLQRNDHLSYFELSEEFITSEKLVLNYINHIFTQILKTE